MVCNCNFYGTLWIPKGCRQLEGRGGIGAACGRLHQRASIIMTVLCGRLGAACLMLVLMSAPAFATDAPHAPSELLFIVQVAVLLLVGRLLGEAMLRMK